MTRTTNNLMCISLVLLLILSNSACSKKPPAEQTGNSAANSDTESGKEGASNSEAEQIVVTAEDMKWIEDFEAAKKKAVEQQKHLLMNFSGSDWCVYCKRLDSEVFSKEAFLKEAAKFFVLVEIDFPRYTKQDAKIRTQNQSLERQFAPDGLPAIFLTDARGRPYAQTGYLGLSQQEYLKHLMELRNTAVAMEELLAKANNPGTETLKPLEKARLLDEAISLIQPELAAKFYGDIIDEIVRLDADDTEGLKSKHGLSSLMARVNEALSKQKFSTADSLLNDAIKTFKLSGQMKQDVYFAKAYALDGLNRKGQVHKHLQIALDAAPNSIKAEQIKMAIRQVANENGPK